MSQLIRASLDLFVALAILITFGQDLYKLTIGSNSSTSAAPLSNSVNGTI